MRTGLRAQLVSLPEPGRVKDKGPVPLEETDTTVEPIDAAESVIG